MKENRPSVLMAWLVFFTTGPFGSPTRLMLLTFATSSAISNTDDLISSCPETAAHGTIDPKIATSFDLNLSYWPHEHLQITRDLSQLVIGNGAEQLLLAADGDPENGWSMGIQFLGDLF